MSEIAYKVVTDDRRSFQAGEGPVLQYLPGTVIVHPPPQGMWSGVFAWPSRDLAQNYMESRSRDRDKDKRGPLTPVTHRFGWRNLRIIRLSYEPVDAIGNVQLRLLRCTVIPEPGEKMPPERAPVVVTLPTSQEVRTEDVARLRVDAVRDGRRTPPPSDTEDAIERRVLELLAPPAAPDAYIDLALAHATDRARNSRSHGPDHWRRVATNAACIAERSGADLLVVAIFAAFHDSQRRHDGHDLEHGPKAAQLVTHLAAEGVLDLNAWSLDRLRFALEAHTIGRITRCPTVGACWDADRLDLGRVGISIDPRYLSTAAAREIADQGVIGPWDSAR